MFIKKLLLAIVSFFLFFSTICFANLPQFEYVNALVLSTEKSFEEAKIGGLSGLTKHGAFYWAVSDDKGQNGEPRAFAFEVTLTPSDFKVQPSKTLFFKDSQGKPFRTRVVDLEGITALGDTLIVSNEGLLNQKPREMPSLFEFSFDGKLMGQIPLPASLLPERTGKQKKGVRANGSLEGLSLSPSGSYLWMVVEQPLLQDFPEWKLGQPGFTKIFRYKRISNKWSVDSEWDYGLEKVPGSGSTEFIVLGQGCSEILALNEREVLVLERGVYTSGTQVHYDVKLFHVSLPDPLPPMKVPQRLSKQLVFDFATIKDKIPDGRGLDNFEGMTFGPEIGGHKTLLFITDDNFTSLQRTIWLALKFK
jgi:hypothetical protein